MDPIYIKTVRIKKAFGRIDDDTVIPTRFITCDNREYIFPIKPLKGFNRLRKIQLFDLIKSSVPVSILYVKTGGVRRIRKFGPFYFY